MKHKINMVRFKQEWSNIAGKMKIRKQTYNSFTRNLSVFIAVFILAAAMAWSPAAAQEENGDTFSAAGDPAPEELLLFDLINNARQNPLQAIESAGLDIEKVLADNQDIADILRDGLPPLEFSHVLYQTAGDHVADMLEKNYYSYESTDGTTVTDRIEQTGYLPVFAGQALGMISFNNYIEQKKAAALIFENMLEDELSSQDAENRKIFNPDLRQAGAALAGGSFRFDRLSANAYVAACDFATPVEAWELELINLINQFRDDPWAVLAYYGIDIDQNRFPELETLLTSGLEPMALDLSLYKAADVLASDILDHGHFTPKTSDGKTLEDRAEQAGYMDWSWLSESRGRFTTCNEIVCPGQNVERIFRYLVSRAFNQEPADRHYPMLAPWAQDCGIRIKAGQSPLLGGICGDHMHILVADFGSRLNAEDPPENSQDNHVDDPNNSEPGQNPEGSEEFGRLAGLVYDDQNINKLYDPKEGLSGLVVTVDKGRDSMVSYKTVTNSAGGFFMELAHGRYRLRIQAAEGQEGIFSPIFRWVDIDPDTSVWSPVVIKPDSEETDKREVLF